ncbi:hypothetical protein ACJX0J_015273 [Zea mays]
MPNVVSTMFKFVRWMASWLAAGFDIITLCTGTCCLGAYYYFLLYFIFFKWVIVDTDWDTCWLNLGVIYLLALNESVLSQNQALMETYRAMAGSSVRIILLELSAQKNFEISVRTGTGTHITYIILYGRRIQDIRGICYFTCLGLHLLLFKRKGGAVIQISLKEIRDTHHYIKKKERAKIGIIPKPIAQDALWINAILSGELTACLFLFFHAQLYRICILKPLVSLFLYNYKIYILKDFSFLIIETIFLLYNYMFIVFFVVDMVKPIILAFLPVINRTESLLFIPTTNIFIYRRRTRDDKKKDANRSLRLKDNINHNNPVVVFYFGVTKSMIQSGVGVLVL